jgi:hypothetical protein
LGSDEGAERGKRGASGSLKPAGSWGEKDREMGRGQLGPRPRGERRRGGGVGVGARWVGIVDRHDMDVAALG